jgi:membrane-associated phospholipid phosphatase
VALLIALTQFGDPAVLLPLIAVMLSWLLFIRCPLGVAWWAVAVMLCAGSTAALKIFFFGCPPAPELHTPSGHTSLSTLVYGAITLASATETVRLRRLMIISAGAGFILAIAASRLLLSIHTALEIGVGLLIGSAALALFGQGYLRLRATQVPLLPLLMASTAIVLVTHGRELHAEELLHGISRYLQIRCSSARARY